MQMHLGGKEEKKAETVIEMAGSQESEGSEESGENSDDEYRYYFDKKNYDETFKGAEDQDFDNFTFAYAKTYRPLIERRIERDPNLQKEGLLPEQIIIRKQEQIQKAYQEVAHSAIPNYQQSFDKAVEENVVVLGEVDVDEIEEEQRKIDEERIVMVKKDAEEFEKQRIEMMKLQEEAKNELFHRNRILAKELEQKEMDAILRARERRALLNRTFMKHEAALEDKIKAADGTLETIYKKVNMNPRGYSQSLVSDSKEREFKVNWKSTPQLINVRIELCRCLRDKIGECHCVITCSIIDQIGGNVLTYQDKENPKNWTETTKPAHHDGQYTSEALRFEQNIVPVSYTHLTLPTTPYV
eukprot:TRINITY_DN1649_c0_g4_i2.p1 TRINITY_DN1649_c0_g4~~TRINITY_DN1649_c0_g4_i2.p1  ORF type:complete len:356 (-),score=135.69 TRINITY_DN1649_c0_g4_i2:45-1112(-)